MTQELRPCPFCGYEAEYDKEHDQFGGAEFDVIQCKNCATQTALWNSKENALIAWNTRHEASRESLKAKLLSDEMVGVVAATIHNSKWLTRQEKAKAALKSIIEQIYG